MKQVKGSHENIPALAQNESQERKSKSLSYRELRFQHCISVNRHLDLTPDVDLRDILQL